MEWSRRHCITEQEDCLSWHAEDTLNCVTAHACLAFEDECCVHLLLFTGVGLFVMSLMLLDVENIVAWLLFSRLHIVVEQEAHQGEPERVVRADVTEWLWAALSWTLSAGTLSIHWMKWDDILDEVR